MTPDETRSLPAEHFKPTELPWNSDSNAKDKTRIIKCVCLLKQLLFSWFVCIHFVS